MQLLKQATPFAVSLTIILLVTAVLFYLNNAQQHHLVFILPLPHSVRCDDLW